MPAAVMQNRKGQRGGPPQGKELRKKPRTEVEASVSEPSAANLSLVVSGGKQEGYLRQEFRERARAWVTKRLSLAYEGDELEKLIAKHMSKLTEEHFQEWKSGEGGWDLER